MWGQGNQLKTVSFENRSLVGTHIVACSDLFFVYSNAMARDSEEVLIYRCDLGVCD